VEGVEGMLKKLQLSSEEKWSIKIGAESSSGEGDRPPQVVAKLFTERSNCHRRRRGASRLERSLIRGKVIAHPRRWRSCSRKGASDPMSSSSLSDGSGVP
jgi:hypothetical protein